MKAVACTFAAALLLPACASEAPARDGFDRSAGEVQVAVAADGFVRSRSGSGPERRQPLELLVLELRWRMREMSADERSRFVVWLRLDGDVADATAAARARAAMNRLVDELMIMGVRQIEYL
jgi:hypothetical protein